MTVKRIPENLNDLLSWLRTRIAEKHRAIAKTGIGSDDPNYDHFLGEHTAYIDVLWYVRGIGDFMRTGQDRVDLHLKEKK